MPSLLVGEGIFIFGEIINLNYWLKSYIFEHKLEAFDAA